jgi:hypothetical protein
VVLVLGEGTTAQDVPSHRSIRVRRMVPVEDRPTAQQSDADTHVVPLRMFVVCPAVALGEATIDQPLAGPEASGLLSDAADCCALSEAGCCLANPEGGGTPGSRRLALLPNVLGKFAGSGRRLVLARGVSTGFRLGELSLRAVGSAPEATLARPTCFQLVAGIAATTTAA